MLNGNFLSETFGKSFILLVAIQILAHELTSSDGSS